MEKQRFSTSGEYFVAADSDGRLRIWETATNILKQEFVSSSHLSAMCTCIEWAPSKPQVSKKKKRRRVIQGEVIAVGTTVGSVLFYSLTESKVLAQSKDSHSGKVTGLSWSALTSNVYSCGEDGCIIEWDPEDTSSLVSKWKGGKGALTGIQVHDEGKYLLAASRGISMFNLETKTLVSSFTGHPSLIDQIEIIPNTDYFITMCHSERNLKIWSTSEKNSIAVLSLTENASNFHVVTDSKDSVVISAVTNKGSLNIFQHKLNGTLKKPLMPVTTLKIMGTTDNAKTVPVLTSFLSKEEGIVVLAGYGTSVKLQFEKFGIGAIKGVVAIEREFSQTTKKKGKTVIPTQRTDVPSDVKHLQPGMDATSKTSKKRKNEQSKPESSDPGELPMEERLTNLTIETPSQGSIPDGNNLAHVLSQGLHSKDTRILHSVLSRWDEEIVASTIRSLPVQLIVPLLTEIKVLLGGKAQLNHSILKWLKSIFQIHSAFLMNCTLSEDLLAPFMSLLLTRETLYPQMCQLRGKLELMKGNIKAKKYCTETANEALLVFQDESSGDDDDEDDGMMPSESEDFLGSDDLGVEEEDDSDSDSDAEPASNDDESIDEDDDNDKKVTKVNKKSNQMKSPKKSAVVKANAGGSDDESMDDDEN